MGGRMLVIGGSGLVGGALLRVGAREGWAVLGTTRSYTPSSPLLRTLDLLDGPAMPEILAEFRPDWVAIPAANPHVDYCEQHPEETGRINRDATIAAIRACAQAGARTIFFSSDYVFDGEKGSYTEEDAVNPLNEYGRQKAAVEAAARREDSRGLVIRSSGIYGWEAAGKNFVLQVRARLSTGQPMRLAADLLYNPTYADDLAAAAVALAAREQSGLFHAAGAESVARYDFAVLAAKTFGLDPSPLVPVPGSEFKSAAPRPKASVLLCGKLARAGVAVPSGAAEGLRRMAATAP